MRSWPTPTPGSTRSRSRRTILRADTTDARTVNVQVSDQNDAPGKPTVGVVTTDRTPLDAEDSTMPSYMVDENHPVKDVVDDQTSTGDGRRVRRQWYWPRSR